MAEPVNLLGRSLVQAAAWIVHCFPDGGGEEIACSACVEGPVTFVEAIISELGIEDLIEGSRTEMVGGFRQSQLQLSAPGDLRQRGRNPDADQPGTAVSGV